MSATIRKWLAEPLPRDVAAALERLARCADVRHVAVMPDVHLSQDVCVGTVVATANLLYPSAVGGDIGCGMAAVAFDAEADEVLRDDSCAARLLAELYRRVPANRQAVARELPAGLAERVLSDPRLEAIKRRDGRVQLGTLGRGNHFLEFQADEAGRLWVMLHTGSRGVGQAIRDHHLAVAAARPASGPAKRESMALVEIAADTPEGEAYLADMAWAEDYARANREAILEAVVDVVRELFRVEAVAASRMDCHHNFVRREVHLGEALWVHRKGAVPAAVGEAGIIPGSMGSASFHVRGRGCEEALCSSSHGAGRTMSRDAARRCIPVRELERQMRGVWFDRRRAALLRDEAPGAYKDVHAVMRAQRELTKVVRRLRPVLSYKGA
jgi:tRNA-splicing ligase RtcB